MKIFSIKYIPLTVVISFNLFTLFMFYTAPFTWKTDNLIEFLFFALLCQSLIIVGYNLGYRKQTKKQLINAPFYRLSPVRLNFVFLFYTFTFLIKYAYLLRIKVLDISGMISFLLIGFGDPQLGYALSVDASRPYTINWSAYFVIAILNQVFFIIGFTNWKGMNRIKKVLFVIFIAIDIFYWMGRGTNFGVISLITTFLFSIIYNLKSIKISLIKAIRFFIVIILLLVGSIAVFSFNLNARRGGAELKYEQFDLGLSSVDANSVALSVVPKPLQLTYLLVVSYLCQGYYHTCLAFDLDFKSTYFLGNNPALIDFAKVAGIDVWKDTYMYRLREKGVDPLVNWHSAYTWYANDVSFICVPFVLFFIGYLFGISWTLSLNGNDFLSKVMFIILGNIILYLFANNTYLSTVFYSFIFILPVWYFTRVKRFKLS